MDYKKYSLENLENWLHDAISCGEASPHEIYSVIRKVVQDEYNYHKEKSQQCFGLLELLTGHRPVNFDDEPSMPPWGHSDLEYLCNQNSKEEKEKCREYNLREAEYYNKRVELDAKQDKVVKWQLPVEMDDPSGQYFVTFPDDLLEAANLKEGDQVEWVDQGDGSYLLRKV